MIHALKCDPDYFKAIKEGNKTFEVRKNDRNFKVGDYLALNELDDTREEYSGEFFLGKITYILNEEKYCKEGYVVLAFKPARIIESY